MEVSQLFDILLISGWAISSTSLASPCPGIGLESKPATQDRPLGPGQPAPQKPDNNTVLYYTIENREERLALPCSRAFRAHEVRRICLTLEDHLGSDPKSGQRPRPRLRPGIGFSPGPAVAKRPLGRASEKILITNLGTRNPSVGPAKPVLGSLSSLCDVGPALCHDLKVPGRALYPEAGAGSR